MRTDYFNLIQSKTRTHNKQNGGVLPIVGKAAAKKVLPLAKKLANEGKEQLKEAATDFAKEKKEELKEAATDSVKKGQETVKKELEKGLEKGKKTVTDFVEEGVAKGKENLKGIATVDGEDASQATTDKKDEEPVAKDASRGTDKGTDKEGEEKTSVEGQDGSKETSQEATEQNQETAEQQQNKDSLERQQQQEAKLLENMSEIEKNVNKSPSYPSKLQIIPLSAHVEDKLSDDFNNHIGKLETAISKTSKKISQQSNYIAEEQRILDKKKAILEKRILKEEKETNKTSWQMTQKISLLAGYFADRIMTIIYKFFYIIIKILEAVQPLLWAIAAIICVFVLIILIAWLIRGGKFKLTDNEGKDLTDSENAKSKAESSSNYAQGGTEEDWDWNNFLKNPVLYSFEQNVNKVNNTLNIPDVLKKVRVQNPLNTFRRTFKLLNNDNFKFEREKNDKQREDNISYINYNLIDSNVSNKYFKTQSVQNNNHSINLLKPKNIEWELPHLDYANKDMSFIPESLKNYKSDENGNFSLNDTSKIIFPWSIVDNEWQLNCNTVFTNDRETGLYRDEGNACVANTFDGVKIN